MKKEFIPYEQALALKKLGFDEQCLALYPFEEEIIIKYVNWEKAINKPNNFRVAAPLYQQAFRWFRDKYDIQVSIQHWCKDSKIREYYYNIEYSHNNVRHGTSSIAEKQYNMFTYEESELECLKKLIEIVKNGN